MHIKGSATHLDRAQLKVREQLIRARLAMGNQLRGLLKLFGLRMGKVTTPAKRAERLEALLAQKPELRPILAPLVAGLEALDAQIAASTRGLKVRAEADPVCQRLMSVPSVGPIIALSYKSSIEDPGRFRRSEDAGAYAGLVPRRSQSGERDYNGRISKAGDPMLRSALYDCQQPALPGQAPQHAADMGQGARGDQGRQACPGGRRPQARHPAPPPLAVRYQLPMGVTP